jgi:hypothetical protein
MSEESLLAQADQAAARLHEWYEPLREHGLGFARLDLREAEALMERGASPEEMRAWVREQIARAETERAMLGVLDPDSG